MGNNPVVRFIPFFCSCISKKPPFQAVFLLVRAWIGFAAASSFANAHRRAPARLSSLSNPFSRVRLPQR